MLPRATLMSARYGTSCVILDDLRQTKRERKRVRFIPFDVDDRRRIEQIRAGSDLRQADDVPVAEIGIRRAARRRAARFFQQEQVALGERERRACSSTSRAVAPFGQATFRVAPGMKPNLVVRSEKLHVVHGFEDDRRRHPERCRKFFPSSRTLRLASPGRCRRRLPGTARCARWPRRA